MLDLSRAMLDRARKQLRSSRPAEGAAHFVRGDALHPPFGSRSFDSAVVLGNVVGFAASDAERMLGEVAELVRTGGILILEVAPGSGERSRYLARLPPSAVGRLFESPPQLIRRRIEAEGFDRADPVAGHRDRFERIDPERVRRWLEPRGFEIVRARAIAPSLASDAPRISAIARSRRAWSRLLAVEEQLGDDPPRWPGAAAVLLLARRRVDWAATAPRDRGIK